jgi:hypothetical protein
MKTNKKRTTPEQRATAFKPTYIFGYGSLLLPQGINGRKMAKQYNWEDLAACTLNGYTRSMCAFFGGRNFYGITENPADHCNGVVFKMDNWYDYRAFLISEGAISGYKNTRTYWPINVAKHITGWKVPKGHRVMTLLCKDDKSTWGRVERGYIRLCHHGAKQWEAPFEAEFLSSGGIPYDGKKMQEIAKEHKIKIW